MVPWPLSHLGVLKKWFVKGYQGYYTSLISPPTAAPAVSMSSSNYKDHKNERTRTFEFLARQLPAHIVGRRRGVWDDV